MTVRPVVARLVHVWRRLQGANGAKADDNDHLRRGNVRRASPSSNLPVRRHV